MKISEEDLKKRLSPEQYRVLVEKGTEAPFSGKYVDHKEKGMYTCAACGADLFHSGTKFESKSGWPSFYDIARSGAVELIEDTRHGFKGLKFNAQAAAGTWAMCLMTRLIYPRASVTALIHAPWTLGQTRKRKMTNEKLNVKWKMLYASTGGMYG